VAAEAGPWWQQVYVLRDRDATARSVENAAAAGAGALVLTVDAPYVAAKPRVRRPLPLPDNELTRSVGLHTRGADQEQDPSIGPQTIDWLRRTTGLPVLVKGVLRADDARECVRAGAAGVIVSNHGGRQLDRAASTARALPAVSRAVGGDVPVLADGGIRTGTDVLTALALGAHAVLVGRPVLWALAVAGASGVRRLFESYREELSATMALAGVSSVAEIGRDLLADT
jgi:4-hydroxymandelate oxidase